MFCSATLLSLGAIVGTPTEATASLTTTLFERPLVSEAMPVRTEHFVFEYEDGSVAGFAVWRRREGRRGVVFEREMTFRVEDEAGADPAIYHVEALEGSGSRLVQRETGPRGRAVLAELATKDDVGRRAIDVTTEYATDGSGRRTNVWRRADGTLVLELTFVGVRLDAFRLQDGGPRARAVSAEEYASRGGSGAAPLAAAIGNTGG